MPGAGDGRVDTPRALLAILAASLLLKLLLLIPAHSTKPFHDALDYVAAALGLLHNGTYGSLRAPAYPALMATLLAVAQWLGLPVPYGAATLPDGVTGVNGFDLVRFFQVLLSTAAVWMYYRLVRQFFDRRAALAASGIVAFYPSMVAYSHLFWTETLFIFLLIGGLLLALRARRSGSARAAAACGVVLGASALTRDIGLLVAGVTALWLWIDTVTDCRLHRQAWSALVNWGPRHALATRLAVAVGIGAVLTVVPWTARNFVRHGEIIVVSASGGVGLLFGATDDPVRELQQMNDPSLRFDPLRRDRRCGERAREIIAADPRGWIERCLTHNVPSLFQPVFDGLISHLLAPNRGYGAAPTWVIRAVLVAVVASYAILAIGVIAGLWLAGERRYIVLFLTLGAAYIAAHTTILGVTRHRLPLEVLGAAYAGFIYSRRAGELRAAATPKRLAGMVVCLVLFGAVVAKSPVERVPDFWRRAAVVGAQR